jgi:DNA-directed RNA polymerase specialized sigma24 family protein
MIDLDSYLTEIAAGDAEAFGRWVTGAEGRLRASLRSFATLVDTESVLQETFLRIWQVAPRHVPDGKPDSLLRLAVRIARNLAVDEVRRLRLPPVDPGPPTPDPPAPDPFLRRLISECWKGLHRKPAAALAARIASGGTESDQVLAARLGMRLNAFLQNVTRARRQLADCLRARDVDLDRELA